MNRDELHRQGRSLSFLPGTSSAADSRTRAAGTPGTFDDCAEFRQLSESSAFSCVALSLFSITYEWQRNCAGPGKSLQDKETEVIHLGFSKGAPS